MTDLREYFSQQDEVSTLKAQVALLTKKVDAESRMKRRYKLKYEQALLKDRRPEVAVELLKERENGFKMTIKQIAHKSRLSESRVKGILTELRGNL